jgi:predicted TIM-barrel enzyme
MSTKVFSPHVSAASDTGQFIVGAAIGSGGAARAAEHGGADFLLVLTAGRFRIRGAASAACMLALDDANTLAQDLVEHEIGPICRGPIFLGLSAMNPKDDLEAMVSTSASLGCAGIMNFPTVAHYPAYIREALDRAWIGFTRELALLARAREAGLEAIAHVTTAEQAEEAARIGADAICLNYGWNTGGDTGARSQISLSEASVIAAEVRRRIRKINCEACLLLEGGPIETSSDLMTVLEASRADGYIGGSTIDRLPMETGTANQVLSFKNTVLALSRQAHQKSNRLKTLEQVGLYGTSRAMVDLADNIAAFKKSDGPALAIGGEGSGRQRVLKAIAMQRGHSLSSVLTLNTDTLTPAQIQNRLLGSTKQPARFGLQAIEQKYLILRNLADLHKPIQRRIAQYLETGT